MVCPAESNSFNYFLGVSSRVFGRVKWVQSVETLLLIVLVESYTYLSTTVVNLLVLEYLGTRVLEYSILIVPRLRIRSFLGYFEFRVLLYDVFFLAVGNPSYWCPNHSCCPIILYLSTWVLVLEYSSTQVLLSCAYNVPS